MKSNQPTRQQREAVAARAAILCYVLKAGFVGVSISALMRLTGRSNTSTGGILRTIYLDGLIERSHGGGNACVWGPPGTWAHYAKNRTRTERACVRQKELRAEKSAALHHVSKVRPVCSIWDAAARCAL